MTRAESKSEPTPPEETHAADRRFRSLIENSSDVITILGADGVVLYESPSVNRVLGYAPEDLMGGIRFNLVHEDDLPRVMDGFSRVLAGERLTLEYRYQHHDGTWRQLESTANNLIHDPDVLGIVVNTRDVTSAREARDALIAQERHFRALIEQSQDGIVLLDSGGTTRYVSPAVLRIVGYTLDELVGGDFVELVHPDDKGEAVEIFDRLVAGEIDSIDHIFRLPHKDGSCRWIEATAKSLLSDPGVNAIVANVRDITERRQSQEALRFQAHVLQAVEQAVVVIDLRGIIIYWNRFAEALYGWPPAEALGRPASELLQSSENGELEGSIHPEPGQRESWSGEMHVKRRDGTTFIAMVIDSPLRDDSSSLVGVIRVSWDVSEQKRAEAAVQEVNAALEGRVRRRTAELEAANRELESFCYAVSHDLRAPLRAVNGFTRAVLDECGGQLDAAGRSYLERAAAASYRMGDLIDALLRLSQIVRAEMRRMPVDLSLLAQETIRDLTMHERDRAVDTVVAEGAVVDGDPNLLGIVLNNLLENAWKYTRFRHPACIEFGILDRGGERIYFVKDNGAGFDMEYANKLFGAFQRLHSALEFEGTGIGLATVQRVIHRHGGRIWAEGAVGVGATFYFTLP